MKNVISIVAMGLYMALAAGSVFAGGHGRDGRMYAQADQYESKIYGTVRTVPQGMLGTWNVNGREINVTRNTLIEEKHGKAEVGAYVEVEGISSGNSLNAYKIEVKRDSREVRSIHGTIESISTGNSGIWTVNGQDILVNRDTRIKEKHGRAIVGAYVEVEGAPSGNLFSAHKIEVKRARR